jgi:hypothetical protein
MATSAEKRAWLVANGHPELAEGKGRLPKELSDKAEAALAPADDYGPGTGPGDFEGPLSFVAADDPPEVSAGDDPTAEDAGAAVAEERPSRPHASRPWFGFARPRAKAKAAGKTRGKTHKRVSIAPLIEDAYSDIAWAAAGIPPLRKLLQAQAPIAGVILDPVVKDTIADPVLQIAARNHERMQVAMALLGTPAALMAVLVSAPEPVLAPMIAEDGTPMVDGAGKQVTALVPGDPSVQHQMAMVSLRYCVRAMASVAGGDSLERIAERAAANVARDDQVNRFIAYLLDIPVAPAADQSQEREARDAGLRLAGVAQ